MGEKPSSKSVRRRLFIDFEFLSGGTAVRFVYFRFQGIADSTLRTRKPDQENRSAFPGLFDAYRSIVVVDDLVDNRETQPRAIGNCPS